jgi:hypothetical protein
MTGAKMEGTPVAAAAVLGRLLPQMTSAVIALSALGYFIGWEEANAYFAALGAPWAVPLLSPLRLLQMSSIIIVPMALTVMLIKWFARGETIARQLRRFAIFAAAVATALLVIGSLAQRWVPPAVGYACSFYGALAYAVTAGSIIGHLLARLSADRLQWSGQHVALLQGFVVVGLIITPIVVGNSRGTADSESGKLPCAQWADYQNTCDWRLVEVIGNSALLMSRGDPGDSATFRVVAMTDIKHIAAPSPKGAGHD